MAAVVAFHIESSNYPVTIYWTDPTSTPSSGSVALTSQNYETNLSYFYSYLDQCSLSVGNDPSGYVFVGWYATSTSVGRFPGSIAEYDLLVSTQKALNLKAVVDSSNVYKEHFTSSTDYVFVAPKYAAAYTVVFKDYDGTVLKTETVASGGNATPPSVSARTGYAFTGWNGTYQNVTSNRTITATYAAKTSALTFNANGGSGTMTTGKVATYGQAMPTGIALPTRTGYTFTGFFDATSGGTKYYNAAGTSAQTWNKDTTSGTTLYAQWTVNTYTVTFDANGGSVPTSTTTVTYGSAYGTLPTPTLAGYTFAGWWTAVSGGTLVTASTVVTTASNHTLYALWTANEILVVFDTQGGSIAGNYYVRVVVGTPYPALPTPTRGADTFDGWYTAKTGGAPVTQGGVLIENASHTLYAHWTQSASANAVHFDAAGGIVSESQRSVSEGVALGTLPVPTRNGYTFQGWFAQITAGSIMGDADIYAVARWQGNATTITFDANGGSVSPASRTVAFGAPYGDLPVPTHASKVFAGWFTASTGGTQVFASTVSQGSATLYAHWNDITPINLWEISFP